jgi:hypothetical protein
MGFFFKLWKNINPKIHISIPFDFLGTIKQIPLWKYPEDDLPNLKLSYQNYLLFDCKVKFNKLLEKTHFTSPVCSFKFHKLVYTKWTSCLLGSPFPLCQIKWPLNLSYRVNECISLGFGALGFVFVGFGGLQVSSRRRVVSFFRLHLSQRLFSRVFLCRYVALAFISLIALIALIFPAVSDFVSVDCFRCFRHSFRSSENALMSVPDYFWYVFQEA